jgi:NAD(P)-dependent dehydrogenase (short-subunit alcohol dehydrogenase family)
MTDSLAYLVTGGAGNLGRAVAGALAAQGRRVAVADRDAAAVTAVVAGLPGAGHAALVGGDLAEPAVCAALAGEATARLGPLAGAAHTVGGFAMGRAVGSASELWDRMLRMNLYTTLRLFEALTPAMVAAGGGSLVAVSAGAALRAPAEMAAYAASKAAVLRLVEAMAAEHSDEGLRVNAVMPGIIDTPQNRAAMPDADPGRWTTPAEVAATIAFLLSPAASGVSGAAIAVTGRALR